MGRKYIIFRADWSEEQGAENRLLAHTGALTDILAEYFDSSNRSLPLPGYRLKEFYQIEQFVDPKFPGSDTHYRTGDWEVARVETYPTEMPNSEFEAIVVCYCQYSPIKSPLKSMPEPQVSLDSFGGDEEAYQRFWQSKEDKYVRESV